MNRKAFWIGLGSTIAAIFTHAYLASRHYQVKFGQIQGDSSICNIGTKFSCDAITASRFSEFLGVPVAIWGIVANVIAVFFAISFLYSDDSTRSSSKRHLLIVSGFIAAVSVVMASISTFAIGTFCPFCMVAYALSFISFAGFFVAAKSSPNPGNTFSTMGSTIKPLILSAIIAAFSGFIMNYGWQKSYGAQNMDQVVRSHVSEWAATTPVEIIPIAPIAKGAEASAAKMTIIEFADFLCPHCKMAGPTLHAFAKANSDVRLVFQNWPLDGECNSAISVKTGLRCGLAKLTYCIESQAPNTGRGWDIIDWIFARQEEFRDDKSILEPTVRSAAKDFGLSEETLLTCVNSDEAQKIVSKQAELGKSLNIQGTPTIFVNGRRLPAGQVLPVLKEAYNQIR